jgi:hypothetical protein
MRVPTPSLDRQMAWRTTALLALAARLPLRIFAQEQPLTVDSSVASVALGSGAGGSFRVIARRNAAGSSEPVSKRLFGIIPKYRADQVSDSYKPLTTAEKYRLACSDSFDWPNYFLLAGFALQSQVAAGGFSHNGGFTGFTQYYARAFGDQISAAT